MIRSRKLWMIKLTMWNKWLIIARRGDNLLTNFGVSRTFRTLLFGQHLSDASRDLATLTFDLGGHGACRRYGSSFSICISSCFSVQKIWRTSGLSNSRPGDLELWPLTLKLVPVGWATFLPSLMFLGLFVLHLSAKTYQTNHVNLWPWPLTLEVLALVVDMGLNTPYVYQVLSS